MFSKTIQVIIIEDSEDFSNALKKVVEEQTIFPCKVHILNPTDGKRERPPTFEEFYNEINACIVGPLCLNLVLLDNQLGKWKWKGANLAPSLYHVISISSDPARWADYAFTRKSDIAYHDNEEAKQQLVAVLVEVLKKALPPKFAAEL